jgi:hypothetical protein
MDVVGVMAAYLPVVRVCVCVCVCVCVLHCLERHCVCVLHCLERDCVCVLHCLERDCVCVLHCLERHYVHVNGHDRTITVILAKRCIKLHDDGSLVIRNMLEHFNYF